MSMPLRALSSNPHRRTGAPEGKGNIKIKNRSRSRGRSKSRRRRRSARCLRRFSTLPLWPLPLLVGGGWEGVRACRKMAPLPNPPLQAGEGVVRRTLTTPNPPSPGDCLQSLPSARRTRASSWAPFAAVRPGRQARRGIDMDVDAFSPGQEPCRKARPSRTHS